MRRRDHGEEKHKRFAIEMDRKVRRTRDTVGKEKAVVFFLIYSSPSLYSLLSVRGSTMQMRLGD